MHPRGIGAASPDDAQFRRWDGFASTTDWDKYHSAKAKAEREYDENRSAYYRAADQYVAERQVPEATLFLASGLVFILLFAAPIAALLLWKRMRFHRAKRELEILTDNFIQN